MRTFLSLVGVGIVSAMVSGQRAVKPKEAMPRFDEERYTKFFGKEGVLQLNFDAIRKQKWLAQSPNPPVSAKEAIEKANVVKKQMLKDDGNTGWSWAIESVALMPLDPGNPEKKENRECWYWLVTYEAFGSIAGQPSQLEVAILMDGTVVRPTIRARLGDMP